MNVFIRAMVKIFLFGKRWNVQFNSHIASLNKTFHLSPHENILTKTLINITYLYDITSSTLYDSIVARCNFLDFCVTMQRVYFAQLHDGSLYLFCKISYTVQPL